MALKPLPLFSALFCSLVLLGCGDCFNKKEIKSTVENQAAAAVKFSACRSGKMSEIREFEIAKDGSLDIVWDTKKDSLSFDFASAKCKAPTTTDDFSQDVALSKDSRTLYKLCKSLSWKRFQLIEHNVACPSETTEISTQCSETPPSSNPE